MYIPMFLNATATGGFATQTTQVPARPAPGHIDHLRKELLNAWFIEGSPSALTTENTDVLRLQITPKSPIKQQENIEHIAGTSNQKANRSVSQVGIHCHSIFLGIKVL